MGAILFKIFKIVEAEGGVPARLKFAQATRISINGVKKVKDKPEYIANFKKIASSILGKEIDEFLPPVKKPVKTSLDDGSFVVEFDPND
ncbi:MAG: hypothetical protein KAR45_14365 [Desulfobacteraceae bacterium]|nr:hypothetical protein [Desulfobacteraceae bacterium]